MKRIVITGAHGYLASLIRLYNSDVFEFIPVSRSDVDYSDPATVSRYFSSLDFDLLFHTAANATTASCENDPAGTHVINCEDAIEIAKICQERGKRMIFISTEQIFNGKTESGPFTEEDEPACVTRYGQQKLEAETWIRENMDDYLVLRLSWMFGMALPGVKPSPGIVVNALKALRTHTPTLFTVNENRCMTYSQRLAEQFPTITELPSGVYHLSSSNTLNTYESAKIVAARFGYSDADIERYILPNTERYADRFRDFRLDSSKIRAMGVEFSTFEEDVDRCATDFGY